MLPSITLRLRLQDITSRIDELPALPAVVVKLQEMLDDPKMSVQDLSRLISTDQVLMMKLLRIANSTFYGFPRKISTLELAIVTLGFDQLKCLSLSLSTLNRFSTISGDKAFNLSEFWEHSIGSGVAARMLANAFGLRIGSEAFVCGLLHDTGKLLLYKFFPKVFSEILQLVKEGSMAFRTAERAVMDVTHSEIGQWLAETWNLPEELVEGIAFHHCPEKAPNHPEMAAVVHLADILCRMVLRGDGGEESVPVIDEYASDLLAHHQDVDRLKLQDYAPQFIDEFEKASVFMPLVKQPSETGVV